MTSSASTPTAARSPLATQGMGVAYATGAIISAQFGSALAKQLMGDLGPWGVVALRLLTSTILLYVFFRPNILAWTRAVDRGYRAGRGPYRRERLLLRGD